MNINGIIRLKKKLSMLNLFNSIIFLWLCKRISEFLGKRAKLCVPCLQMTEEINHILAWYIQACVCAYVCIHTENTRIIKPTGYNISSK